MSKQVSKLLARADELLAPDSDKADKIYGPFYWQLYYAREEYEKTRKQYSRIGRLLRGWDISSQFHQSQMRLWNLCNSYEKIKTSTLGHKLPEKYILINHTVGDKVYTYCITKENFSEWKSIFDTQLFNSNHLSYQKEIYKEIQEKLEAKNNQANTLPYDSFADFINDVAETIDNKKIISNDPAMAHELMIRLANKGKKHPEFNTEEISLVLAGAGNKDKPRNTKVLSQKKRSEMLTKIIKPSAESQNERLNEYREEKQIKPLPLKAISRFRDKQFGYGYTKDGGSKAERFGIGYDQWEITGYIEEGDERKIASEFQGALQEGWYMYVITTDNKFLYLPAHTRGKNQTKMEYDQYRAHSELAYGKATYGAGTFHVEGTGVIDSITTASGHYQPGNQYLDYAKIVLETLGIPIKKDALKYDFYKQNTRSNPFKTAQHYMNVFKQTFFAKFKKDKSRAEDRVRQSTVVTYLNTPY